jgi:hypothetical protein
MAMMVDLEGSSPCFENLAPHPSLQSIATGPLACSQPRPKRVHFAATLTRVHVETDADMPEDLQALREAGLFWMQVARDQQRFRDRVTDLGPLLHQAQSHRHQHREAYAARCIQAAWRGHRVRLHGSLAWINRQSSLTDSAVAISAASLSEDIRLLQWSDSLPASIDSAPLVCGRCGLAVSAGMLAPPRAVHARFCTCEKRHRRPSSSIAASILRDKYGNRIRSASHGISDDDWEDALPLGDSGGEEDGDGMDM